MRDFNCRVGAAILIQYTMYSSTLRYFITNEKTKLFFALFPIIVVVIGLVLFATIPPLLFNKKKNSVLFSRRPPGADQFFFFFLVLFIADIRKSPKLTMSMQFNL